MGSQETPVLGATLFWPLPRTAPVSPSLVELRQEGSLRPADLGTSSGNLAAPSTGWQHPCWGLALFLGASAQSTAPAPLWSAWAPKSSSHPPVFPGSSLVISGTSSGLGRASRCLCQACSASCSDTSSSLPSLRSLWNMGDGRGPTGAKEPELGSTTPEAWARRQAASHLHSPRADVNNDTSHRCLENWG